MTFKDKTFCASPDCDDSCGRRMTNQERSQLNGLKKMHGKDYPVSYGYFCGELEPTEIKQKEEFTCKLKNSFR